jgi:acetyltransferase-like isoleucine patch superfamily enzyme
MVNLIIVGTGAVAAEITGYLETAEYKWKGVPIQIKGYLEYEEYRYLHAQYKYKAPVLGTIDDYLIKDKDVFIIANANVFLRKQFFMKLKAKGANFINLIHPTCILAPTSVIGIGNIMSPYCQVGPVANVGDFNIMTTGTMISHDCVVGNFNSFSSVIVCGHVTIGNENSLYIRSTIIPYIIIGDGCTIQSGMVVDKNVPNGTTVFYKYKERILAIPQK